MRAAHTLAGISSTVGFAPPADLAQAFEYWLTDIMHNPRTLDAEALHNLRETLDHLKAMVGAIQNGVQPQMATAIAERLRKMVVTARSAREQAEAQALEIQQAPELPPEEAQLAEPELINPSVPPVAPLEPEIIVTPVQPPAATFTHLKRPPRPENLPTIEIDSSIKDDVDEQLLPVFQEEAEELMPYIGNQLRAWREAPGESAAPQALNRALHTLKGSARMAGAMRMGDLTHRMEACVLAVREGEIPSTALFDELEAYFDAIGDLHDALVATEISVVPLTSDAPSLLSLEG